MDAILEGMANELHAALVERGLDPQDPPQGGPPASAAFAEYQKRGGTEHTDPDQFAAALVQRVKDNGTTS